MIGKSDDTEAGPTGPVDGSVDASIFNEDQFAQTAISSSQKIVFIGWPEGTGDYIDAIRLDKFQSRAWFCQDGTVPPTLWQRRPGRSQIEPFRPAGRAAF
ncbi:hypothetical protein [uncultured Senegalimassilia sp.]|uniref:hypothetical protein n=1 Tax=uncultured Senegalimassilia sp. TaxID=1714350 RepID=UPI0025EF63CF|nr:hypothetical protein [uncultured Senegalimassilia sp.]